MHFDRMSDVVYQTSWARISFCSVRGSGSLTVPDRRLIDEERKVYGKECGSAIKIRGREKLGAISQGLTAYTPICNHNSSRQSVDAGRECKMLDEFSRHVKSGFFRRLAAGKSAENEVREFARGVLSTKR
jgi:hypothetical protein